MNALEYKLARIGMKMQDIGFAVYGALKIKSYIDALN